MFFAAGQFGVFIPSRWFLFSYPNKVLVYKKSFVGAEAEAAGMSSWALTLTLPLTRTRTRTLTLTLTLTPTLTPTLTLTLTRHELGAARDGAVRHDLRALPADRSGSA